MFAVCVFLSNGTCVCVDVEHGINTNSATILKTLIETEELRLPPVAMDVFALWMISPELGNSQCLILPVLIVPTTCDVSILKRCN